jgi:hydrogenase maturation protease
MMVAPALVIGIGNESRGDDALAPLLLRKLDAWLAKTKKSQVELLEDFQLQVEHAVDLLERELVLFIDAGIETAAPYSFYRIRPDSGQALFSHALAPEAVLATYMQVYGQEPPPAFVLCLRGEQFELGKGLSTQATSHLQAAHAFMRKLLQEISPAAWDEHATNSLT